MAEKFEVVPVKSSMLLKLLNRAENLGRLAKDLGLEAESTIPWSVTLPNHFLERLKECNTELEELAEGDNAHYLMVPTGRYLPYNKQRTPNPFAKRNLKTANKAPKQPLRNAIDEPDQDKLNDEEIVQERTVTDQQKGSRRTQAPGRNASEDGRINQGPYQAMPRQPQPMHPQQMHPQLMQPLPLQHQPIQPQPQPIQPQPMALYMPPYQYRGPSPYSWEYYLPQGAQYFPRH